MHYSALTQQDPEAWASLVGEITRQEEGLELIASENYVSDAVLEAMGTIFTNKYSEGYPGKRYYGGQKFTDQIESLAIERAKKLFRGADHANVQPLSGAIANQTVVYSWLEPGDTILGFELSHGGHLTHGSPVTMMAKIFNFIRYSVEDFETGIIDFNKVRDLAIKHKPKMILAGYSAYPKDIEYEKFKEIADEVGAVLWADIAHIAGLISAGEMKNPFDYGFHIISSTTHKTLRGPRGGLILARGKVSNPLKKISKKVENIPTLVDRTLFPGLQGGPIMNIIYAKAVAFNEALMPEFKIYARQIISNAKKLATELTQRGFKLYTNGTENHLIVADMTSSFNLSGGVAEEVLDEIGLTTSKSTIPFDKRPPYDPSGLRIGTPAMTTRGLKEKDMELVAEWIYQAIVNREDKKRIEELKNEVRDFCKKLYYPNKFHY